MKRHTIEYVAKVFAEHGYVLDDVEYRNASHKMKCHDNEGFYYECSFGNIVANKNPRKYIKYNSFSLYNIQHLIDLDGIKTCVISDKYINEKTAMNFICECGNEFTMNLNSLLRGKRRCADCEFKISQLKTKAYSKDESLTKIEYHKKRISDKCNKYNYNLYGLDDVYTVSDEFGFKCNKHAEHGIQYTTYSKFITGGSSCRYCAFEKVGKNNRLDLNDVKQLIESKGFDYVDHEYLKIKNASRIRIKCKCKTCNKIWRTTVDNLRRFSCPNCKSSNYEKITRDAL